MSNTTDTRTAADAKAEVKSLVDAMLAAQSLEELRGSMIAVQTAQDEAQAEFGLDLNHLTDNIDIPFFASRGVADFPSECLWSASDTHVLIGNSWDENSLRIVDRI